MLGPGSKAAARLSALCCRITASAFFLAADSSRLSKNSSSAAFLAEVGGGTRARVGRAAAVTVFGPTGPEDSTRRDATSILGAGDDKEDARLPPDERRIRDAGASSDATRDSGNCGARSDEVGGDDELTIAAGRPAREERRCCCEGSGWAAASGPPTLNWLPPPPFDASDAPSTLATAEPRGCRWREDVGGTIGPTSGYIKS